MKHTAQATKNRKVNAFVASLRNAIKYANRGVRVGNAYRSATGDRFEIARGSDVVLVQVDKSSGVMSLMGVERDRRGSVTLYKPKVAKSFRAFARMLTVEFGIELS